MEGGIKAKVTKGRQVNLTEYDTQKSTLAIQLISSTKETPFPSPGPAVTKFRFTPYLPRTGVGHRAKSWEKLGET